MGLKDLDIKISYTSQGEDNIASKLINPALKVAKIYKRSVGFFSSSAIELLFEGLNEFINNGEKILLVTSIQLNQKDIDIINKGYTDRNIVISNSFENHFLEVIETIDDNNLRLLYELIVRGKLEVKIATLKYTHGMYHDKLGIIEDYNGDKIVFFGSPNSSKNGYEDNYEKIRISKSWIEGQIEIVNDELNEFDQIWNENNPFLDVTFFTKAAEKNIIKVAQERKINLNKNTQNRVELRDYQKDAISAWINNNYRGFYSMATGTGKTWTAIYSAKALLEKHEAVIVITAPYKHLVSQWAEDVSATFPDATIILVSSENSKWEEEMNIAFVRKKLLNDRQIIIISTMVSFELERFKKILYKSNYDKLLIVDEAHRFTKRSEFYKEQYKYMLGLSATPYSGTEMSSGAELMNYFGGQVYDLSIEDALNKKFLVPYNYYPIYVYASEEEEKEFNKYTSNMMASFRNGACIDKEKLSKYKRMRLRIISMAAEKKEKIETILKNINEKDHLIVYCGDGKIYDNEIDELRHIEFIKNELEKINHRPSQFTATENITERMQRVESFNKGSLTALAAIRCLDEGINIPSIQGALILSSNDSYREFAQRRGRILRLYPDKKSANIYDVIVLPSINCVGMAKVELRRFYEYAKLALNADELTKELVRYLDLYDLTYGDIEYTFENSIEVDEIYE